MKGDAVDWNSSLRRPSMPLSLTATVLGTWAIILSIVNISIGAYSPGRKALWSGFITQSRESNTVNMGIVLDDLIFLGLGAFLCVVGVIGMRNSLGKRPKGDIEPLIPFLQSRLSAFFNNLTTLESGLLSTLSSWLICIGIIFYFAWCISYNTWLDPGVYSVTISFVSFGIGLYVLDNTKN